MAKWKSFPNAIAAANKARALAQARCARLGIPHPEQPDYYGAGKQPSPLSSGYLEFYVRPVDSLVPAIGEAIADPGMSGAVDPDQLSPADQAKLRDESGRLPSAEATKIESPTRVGRQ